MIPTPTLTPGRYLLLDRVTKLAGLFALVVGLEGAAGALSPLAGLGGILLGVATVFVDEPDAEGSAPSVDAPAGQGDD